MDFNAEPFWDDFEASNGAREQNYMRILFRPGYAVQARELTQIQSIIQNQIKQFGNHIFKSGSPVTGGHMSIDTCQYLKLNPQIDATDIDVADFNDNIILNYSGNWGKRARVIAIYDSETTPTLMIRYLRGNDFEAGETIQTPEGVFALVSSSSTYSGTGSIAYIEEGVFYVNGFFVYVEAQSIVLDAFATKPSYKIGLEIEEEIIDESADAALLDPAQESFNYQAPGAHRYKFSLNLSKRTLTSTDDGRFFELLRVEEGVVTKRVDTPIYSEIDRTLARRASDATGNFVVDPFEIFIRKSSSSANAIVELGAGKAYVNGYEFVTVGPQRLNLDKARTTANVTDYDLSLEYGNRLYANNFTSSGTGLFDLPQLPVVQLHCVPKASINVSGTQGYTTTLMGTARLVNFDRNEGSEYSLNLVDIDIRPNTVVLSTGTGSASNVKLPGFYSATNNAYINVIVTIASCATNQALVGIQREIISYDGATKSAYFDNALPTNDLTSGDKITLKYQSTDIESIVQPNSSNTAFLNSMDISSSSRYGTYNFTTISDKIFDTLIFPLPEFAISNTAFTNTDFYHKKYNKDVPVVAGSKQIDLSTASTGESFYYGTNGAALSSAQANTHFIVIPQTISGTSTYTVGTPVAFTSSGTPNITRNDSEKMTVNFGPTSNVTSFSFIASVKSSTSPLQTINVRTKTCVPATGSEFTQLRTTDKISNATHNTTGSTRVDAVNGIVWIQSPNRTTSGYDSLLIPDVYSLIKVYDSGDPAIDVTSSNALDITSRYFLDSGQTPTYYDHARIKLKPNAVGPKGRIAAIVRFYKHDETKNGYFNAYSYPGDHYENNKIPLYKTSDGREFNLRDCVDFRPTKTLGSTTSVFNGGINPIDTMETSYKYYLPRTDKIILTPENGIQLINGVPSKFPAPPIIDNKKAMELYTLSVPAYTYDLAKIGITETDNKRYTMKDIGALEQRIERIEFYTSMTRAEVAAKDKVLLYNDLTQKEKYGIIADGFTDFSKADLISPDLACAIEFGTLTAACRLNNINMKLDYSDQDVIRNNSKTVCLPYTETTLISQTKATSNVGIMNYIGGKLFKGTMQLIPEADEWFSSQYPPAIIGEVGINPETGGQTSVTAAQAAEAESSFALTGANKENTFTPFTILGYQQAVASDQVTTSTSSATSKGGFVTTGGSTTVSGGGWGAGFTPISVR